MIIGLSGKKGAGKTTVANYLVDEYRFYNISWAYPIKENIGRNLFMLTEEQMYDEKLKAIKLQEWDMTPRFIFQVVGDMFRDYFRDDFWSYIGMKRIRQILTNSPTVDLVISDCRLSYELDAIKTLGGTTVRIIKEGNEETDSHDTETGLDGCKHDEYFRVPEGRTSQLYELTDELIERSKNGR